MQKNNLFGTEVSVPKSSAVSLDFILHPRQGGCRGVLAPIGHAHRDSEPSGHAYGSHPRQLAHPSGQGRVVRRPCLPEAARSCAAAASLPPGANENGAGLAGRARAAGTEAALAAGSNQAQREAPVEWRALLRPVPTTYYGAAGSAGDVRSITRIVGVGDGITGGV